MLELGRYSMVSCAWDGHFDWVIGGFALDAKNRCEHGAHSDDYIVMDWDLLLLTALLSEFFSEEVTTCIDYTDKSRRILLYVD